MSLIIEKDASAPRDRSLSPSGNKLTSKRRGSSSTLPEPKHRKLVSTPGSDSVDLTRVQCVTTCVYMCAYNGIPSRLNVCVQSQATQLAMDKTNPRKKRSIVKIGRHDADLDLISSGDMLRGSEVNAGVHLLRQQFPAFVRVGARIVNALQITYTGKEHILLTMPGH